VLAVVLINKLDTLIESCKNQAKYFENADLTISESCSLAMMQAYMTIREFVQNNVYSYTSGFVFHKTCV